MNLQEAINELAKKGSGFMIKRPFWSRGLVIVQDPVYGIILGWHDAPSNTPVYPLLKLQDQAASDFTVVEVPKDSKDDEAPKVFYGRLMYCYTNSMPTSLYPRIVVGRTQEGRYIAIERKVKGDFVYETWESVKPLDFDLVEIAVEDLLNPSTEE